METPETLPPQDEPLDAPPPAGPRFLHSVRFRNLLSFSPASEAFPLRSLNVLIGPNGSGKSNLLDAVSLLRSTTTDLRPALKGGTADWIWMGRPDDAAELEFVVDNPKGNQAIRHTISFRADKHFFRLVDERIENELPYPNKEDVHFFYRLNGGLPFIRRKGAVGRLVPHGNVDFDRSIVAQRSDPETYPELTYLADSYGKIRSYREWSFGRESAVRRPQKTDLRSDRLEDDFSNLGMFLNRLRRNPTAKRDILSKFRDLYDGLTDFEVGVEGGTVQVYFIEGDYSIPASRLSDGSLRYLCLLAILCDPNPPPLICLDEPELGLHPDLVSKIAGLLIEASERCQLIVTTHSDIIVDALTERPEDVVVCENSEGATTMRRMDAVALKPWLEQYRLGELWSRGEIGGNRW